MSQFKLAALILTAVAVISMAQIVYIFEPPQSDLILRLAQAQVVEHERVGVQALNEGRHEDVGGGLDALAFEPAWPQRLPADLYRVVATRQVVVEGQVAVQFRLLDRVGNRLSLFVMPQTEALFPLHNSQQLRGKWLVSYWREGGQFYSLVKGKSGP